MCPNQCHLTYHHITRLLITRLSFILYYCVLCASVLHGQTASDLQKEQSRLNKKIELTNKYLKNTKSKKTKVIDEYKVIKEQVKNREQLISNISKQLVETEAIISAYERQLENVKEEYTSVKENWGHLLRANVKQKLSSNILVDIISAESLKESFRKLQYYNQLTRYTDQKGQNLKIHADSINYLLGNIKESRLKQEELLSEGDRQKKQLSSELNKQNSTLKSLEKDEKKLLTQLREQQKEKEKLEQLISDAIRRELNRSGNSTTEDIALSGSFEDNKGRLPWPVRSGIISTGFGTRTHPTNRNVKIDNDGIDIRTNPGSEVKSIFSGTVTSINQIPGFGNVVIINVGSYFLVYGRLAAVNVQAGQQIDRGQKIGSLAITNDISELQLQIWKGQSKLNPQQWLIKK